MRRMLIALVVAVGLLVGAFWLLSVYSRTIELRPDLVPPSDPGPAPGAVPAEPPDILEQQSDRL